MKKRSPPNLEYKKRETWNHRHSTGISNKSLHLSTAYLVLPQSPVRLSATLRNIQNVFSTCAPSCKIKHWPTQAEHDPVDMHKFCHIIIALCSNQSQHRIIQRSLAKNFQGNHSFWQITTDTSRKRETAACLNFLA